MPVDTQHKLYAETEQKARRVRDAVAGTDAVKARANHYLRDPDPSDPKRFKDYKDSAQFLGVTKRTRDWMVGAIFRKAPTVELPAILEPILQDADGSGQSLTQFSRNVTSQAIVNGRHGVLVEYPEAEPGATKADNEGRHATLKAYSSQSIINWRHEGDNLVLVVLRETYDHMVDEFEVDEREQFRVLSLDEGQYLQRVFRDGEEVSRIEPRMADGNRWPVIPFQFVGVVNNDSVPDNPLLLDLADVNIGHLRNSADVEEAAFLVGQPMFHINTGETSAEDWATLNPDGITVGSRRGIQTQGGSAELIQAEERNLPMKLMEHKEQQMQAIGARLIEQRGTNETAEAVKARSGSDSANLATVGDNVSDALENCMEWAALFMTVADVDDQISVELNRSFYDQSADPQEVAAYIQMTDRGLAAPSDFLNWARERGLVSADRSNEDILAEAESSGMNLGGV